MTKNLKISLIILAILLTILFISQNRQLNYNSKSSKLFTIDKDDIVRFLIQNKSDAIELSKNDSVWTISGVDSLEVKQQSIDNFFDKVLLVETSTLVSKNPEKWLKYSVDDSTGTHLALIDSEGNTKNYAVFGRSKSDFSRNYVRKQQNPEVYLTSSSVLHFISTSPNYWGELPKLDVESIPLEDEEIK